MISKLQIHTINLLNKHPKKILFLILIIIFNPSGFLTGNEKPILSRVIIILIME